jgi:hypothetical protein
LEFASTRGVPENVREFKRLSTFRHSESRTDALHPEIATLLIVCPCYEDPSLLNAVLGDDLPPLACPCPIILTSGEKPGWAKVYWKDASVPEEISGEALQAENEQLLYCHSEDQALYEECRRWMKNIRFLQIERDNRLLRGGLRLILLAGDCADILEQFPAFAPRADAVVFAGPGLRMIDALGQRFFSVNLYGARRRDVFFVLDGAATMEQEGQGELLRHYLAPVFAGKEGLVDERLYQKRVFHTASRAVQRVRNGPSSFALTGRCVGERGPESTPRLPEFEAELYVHLHMNERLYARASGAAGGCPAAR